MRLSNRQRTLLESLFRKAGETTAGELADEAQISVRTVHRELQQLETLLASYGIRLVKKSGIGMMLEGDEERMEHVRELLRNAETETYSPEERQALILICLLQAREPIKMYALARQVQAAIPTVSRDLDEMTGTLARHGLSIVRKRGYGVEMEGTESARRGLILSLAERYLDHADWFGITESAGDGGTVVRPLLQLAGKPLFPLVEQTLWEQAEEWLNGLQEADYTRLIIQLTIALKRWQEGYEIADEARDFADNSSRTEDGGYTDNSKMIAALTAAFHLPATAAELRYLLQLLHHAKKRAADVSAVILDKYGLDLAERAIAFIRCVEASVDIPFGKDRSLLDGLIRHLGPALERISRQEAIRNPLLAQIRKDYADLFAVVKTSAADIWPEPAVPDEEIGYLTMHFGAAAERWELAPGPVRALLVCTSGIGSSKLLAVRLTKEMPQIELVGLYSWYEASRVPEDQYDLIVSTVDLPVAPDRYIKISPLMSAEETARLRTRLLALTGVRTDFREATSSKTAGAWQQLRQSAEFSAELVDLLKPFKAYNWNNRPYGSDRRRLLQAIVDEAAKTGRLLQTDAIVKALMEREKQGGLLIPGTRLALYHARSEQVRKPLLQLFRLQTPISLNEEGAPEAGCVLLMLAPLTLDKLKLALLSEVSALLLEPALIRLLEGDSGEDLIRDYICERLEKEIQNILEWRDHL